MLCGYSCVLACCSSLRRWLSRSGLRSCMCHWAGVQRGRRPVRRCCTTLLRCCFGRREQLVTLSCSASMVPRPRPPGLGRGIITAPWKLHTHARARHMTQSHHLLHVLCLPYTIWTLPPPPLARVPLPARRAVPLGSLHVPILWRALAMLVHACCARALRASCVCCWWPRTGRRHSSA